MIWNAGDQWPICLGIMQISALRKFRCGVRSLALAFLFPCALASSSPALSSDSLLLLCSEGLNPG